MLNRLLVVFWMALLTAGCHTDDTVFVVEDGYPAPPMGLEGSYFNRAVALYWTLSPQWNGESFRVFGRRVGDSSFFLIADVTSCSGGECEYTDTNIVPSVSYEYIVSSVDPDTGAETDADVAVTVAVPSFDAPPVPVGVEVVALDNTNYVRWGDSPRSTSDFSHYRLYLVPDDGGALSLLGDSDSPGFLDELASNGVTSSYVVSSVDVYGHESVESATASGTPRPDFRGELIYSFADEPGLSGFRFPESEEIDPVTDGISPVRDFRLQADQFGWWLVPGPSGEAFPEGVFTTQLKCGVAADSECEDWTWAPLTGYTSVAVAVEPELTYMWRVEGDAGAFHYGSIRVTLLGSDQNGASLMIFDWSFQLQAGNPQMIRR